VSSKFEGVKFSTFAKDKELARRIFAASLRRIRKECQLSQHDMAEGLRVSVDTIKGWENPNKTSMPSDPTIYVRLSEISQQLGPPGWTIEQILKGTKQDDSEEFANMPMQFRKWHPIIRQFAREQIGMLDDLDTKLKSGDSPASAFMAMRDRNKPTDQD